MSTDLLRTHQKLDQAVMKLYNFPNAHTEMSIAAAPMRLYQKSNKRIEVSKMKVLILGNGFDLAHKLPTKYVDFLNATNEFLNFHKNPLLELL